MEKSDRITRKLITIAALLLCVTAVLIAGTIHADAASLSNSTGKVNSSGGAYVRSKASTSSKQVCLLKDNTKLTIKQEYFTTNSTKASTRWYLVSANGKSGYIRADLVDSISCPNAAGKTTDVVNYRTGPGTKMTKKGTIKKGKSVTVQMAAKMAGDSTVWYRVNISGSTYYMSSEYVKLSGSSGTSNKNIKGVELSGGKYPGNMTQGSSFVVTGTLKASSKITAVTVGVVNSSGKWVVRANAKPNSTSYNLANLDSKVVFRDLSIGKYNYKVIATVNGKQYTKLNKSFKVTKCDVADKLKTKATNGGAARVVYTFTSSNCSKLFSVTGYNGINTPQGMAYTGDRYYFLFGNYSGQRIVTYTAVGKRVSAVNFNIGKPNAITWVPKTNLCYIFRGSSKTIYTWNPATGRKGTAKTPYSSSGIAYDESTGLMYATSLTGVRVYSADGKFTHKKFFNRCTHSGTTYVQDCGAGGGYVFHAISGSNKFGTNYIDVYKVSSGKYMGSIKLNMGELESLIVDKDGYLIMLLNTSGTPDYIWKTPLNVNDLD